MHGKRGHLRNLAGWLTLVPVVLLILFCSGQISVWGLRVSAAHDIHSQLTVDYERWPYEEVAPMNPAVLDIIRREDGQVEGTEPVVPGVFLPTPAGTRPRSGSAATPVSMVVSQTSSPTSVPTVKPATQTPLPTQTRLPPTHTQTLSVPSATIAPTRTKTTLPSATRTATLTPTRTATYLLVIPATRTRTSTPRPNHTATRTSTSTNTQVPSATATHTSIPSSTLTATYTPSVTRTASVTFTPTATLARTNTPTPTDAPTSTYTLSPTDTPTSTQVGTPTFTPTSIPTATDTPIAVVTHTPTITLTPTDASPPTETPARTVEPTSTHTPTQIPLPPGMNIGPRDGSYIEIGCGSGIIVDLGSQTWIGQLVFYEVTNPSDPGYVALDWVLVSVSANSTGPWSLIFYWGDTNSGNNGDIPVGYYPPENDNQRISFGELYNVTGIRINVAGTYRYVLVEAPPACDDAAQVDAIEVLP